MATKKVVYQKSEPTNILNTVVTNNAELRDAIGDAIKRAGGFSAEAYVQAQNAIEHFAKFDIEHITVTKPNGNGTVTLNPFWTLKIDTFGEISNKAVDAGYRIRLSPVKNSIEYDLGGVIPDDNKFGKKASGYTSYVGKKMTSKFITKCDEANHTGIVVAMFLFAKGTTAQADIMTGIENKCLDSKGQIAPDKVTKFMNELDTQSAYALLG